jgi:lipopolysaccharide assembly outer membrane protein LptD (OstA)
MPPLLPVDTEPGNVAVNVSRIKISNCFIIGIISGVCACLPVFSQNLLQPAEDGTDLFRRFQEAQFEEKTDREVMEEEFRRKRAVYESLMSRETPILFQSDFQEIDDETRTFILSGNVQISKDTFKITADWVRIYQWTGELEAKGHVVVELDRDVLTGDDVFFNFNTGTGWVTNARAVIEPQIYLEADLLERLPDYDKTGQGQYALHKGTITACSGRRPAWRFDTKYAVIRMDNYVHMNNVSAWIRRMPVFWMPYFFYPTKTDRTTGLLTPRINWSSNRGFMYSQEFFLAINDYLDTTVGISFFTGIGLQKEFQFRNAFGPRSRGEINFEHIREKKSPSPFREPMERWKGTYEQNVMFPYEIRGTANLMYQSDDMFQSDYGDPGQGITQFLDSRMSLSRYWGTAGLTLDGSYQRNASAFYDERLHYMPRLEYSTGWRRMFDNFRWQMRLKGERLYKSTMEDAFIDNGEFSETERVRLDNDAFRYMMFGSVGYDYNEIPWMSIYPWLSVEERFWNRSKSFDQRFVNDTWATFKSEPEEPEMSWMGGLNIYENGVYRHLVKTGVDFTGPRFYRIFDFLGYPVLSRMKHLIEPKISLEYTPELTGQDWLIYFDRDDDAEAGTRLTYSITMRLLMKLAARGNRTETFAESTDNKDSETNAEDNDGDRQSRTEQPATERSAPQTDAVIREFGSLTISQTYDFLKRSRWDDREVQHGQDERIYYPYSNLALNLTINPFAALYFSGRVEYDPWHDSFSNGFVYGHVKQSDWEFGLRWDFRRNFLDEFYDFHGLAIEGGASLSDAWRFASWIKYDFSNDYIPYIYLDVTYTAECWGITLHTYYKNEREYDIVNRTFQSDPSIKFGLSFHLKNIDTIEMDSFGKFWWGGR